MSALLFQASLLFVQKGALSVRMPQKALSGVLSELGNCLTGKYQHKPCVLPLEHAGPHLLKKMHGYSHHSS